MPPLPLRSDHSVVVRRSWSRRQPIRSPRRPPAKPDCCRSDGDGGRGTYQGADPPGAWKKRAQSKDLPPFVAIAGPVHQATHRCNATPGRPCGPGRIERIGGRRDAAGHACGPLDGIDNVVADKGTCVAYDIGGAFDLSSDVSRTPPRCRNQPFRSNRCEFGERAGRTRVTVGSRSEHPCRCLRPLECCRRFRRSRGGLFLGRALSVLRRSVLGGAWCNPP